MRPAPLSPAFVRLALWFERWVLAGLSLGFAWDHLVTVRLLQALRASPGMLLPARLAASDSGLATGVDFADLARYGLMGVANACAAVFLLGARKAEHPPRRVAEVAVPLAATYCALLLNFPGWVPAWATAPLVPRSWEVPLAALGVSCSVLGGLVSLGGLLWLGRSLGIFVLVRRVVLAGPYRRVRHPIYAGYTLGLAGIVLTGCTLWLGLVATLTVGLLFWRARLEERSLGEVSPAYRRRRTTAGFFLPRRELLRHGLGGGRPAEAGKVRGALAPEPELLFNARSVTHG